MTLQRPFTCQYCPEIMRNNFHYIAHLTQGHHLPEHINASVKSNGEHILVSRETIESIIDAARREAPLSVLSDAFTELPYAVDELDDHNAQHKFDDRIFCRYCEANEISPFKEVPQSVN